MTCSERPRMTTYSRCEQVSGRKEQVQLDRLKVSALPETAA